MGNAIPVKVGHEVATLKAPLAPQLWGEPIFTPPELGGWGGQKSPIFVQILLTLTGWIMPTLQLPIGTG